MIYLEAKLFNPLHKITLFIFLSLGVIIATAQNKVESYQHAINLYQQATQNQSLWINGSQYIPLSGKLRGSAYYFDGLIENGTITYEGITFSNIPMYYDMVEDELIILHKNKEGYEELVQLYKEKIDSFKIYDQHFIHYQSNQIENLESGFYQMLFQGKIALIKQITKNAQSEFSQEEITTYFIEKERYYLLHDENVFQVNDKRSLLKHLSDQKDILVEYIKTQSLRFKENKESDMIKLIKYYDQIEN